MKKCWQTLIVLSILFYAVLPAWAGDVYSITVQGAINPPVAGFIAESIARSEEKNGEALVILLDTPGGLDTSMRDIVKSIMEATIPVIVYVYPSGARAASAGAVILLSAGVAAMAPGTNVGAAHPVNLVQEKTDKTMMDKVTNDAEAYVRSIAAKKGRNADWAARMVRESASFAAQEALANNIAGVIAANPEDLLKKIDGWSVETKNGKVTLNTRDKKLLPIEMPFKYRFLSYISDPNVAYILMMIGIYGILFEIYSPGAMFPGVVGGISLVLALYAFQTIPISYAGVFLILLGIIFFILELKIISHGLLGIAGIVAIVIGSIMLVDLPGSSLGISWKAIAAVGALSGIFFFAVLSYAVKAQLSKVKTGSEGMVGERGVTRSEVFREGKVFLHGELWNAESDERIGEGERVVVTGVKGLLLKVNREGGE